MKIYKTQAVEEAELNGKYVLLCCIPDSTIIDTGNEQFTAYELRIKINRRLAEINEPKVELEGK